MKAMVAALLLGAFVSLCAIVGGREWHVTAFSYALLWPGIFAFAVLPGVLIGFCVRTWHSSVVLTEITTILGATMIVHPTLEQLVQPSFAILLVMAHLAVFPPLLLSVMIGHYSRSWWGQKRT